MLAKCRGIPRHAFYFTSGDHSTRSCIYGSRRYTITSHICDWGGRCCRGMEHRRGASFLPQTKYGVKGRCSTISWRPRPKVNNNRKGTGIKVFKTCKAKGCSEKVGASLDKKGHSRGVWNAFCRSCIGKSKAHPCKTDSTEIRDASTLRRHLFRTREAKCSECKLREWQSQPIPLEVDHLDGKASNNAEIGAEGFLSSLISRRGFTMRIPVTLEEGVPAWTQEACCFCGTPTLFWTALTGRQEGEQVACCQSCAGKYRAEDVPSKRYWFLVSSWLR